MDSLKYKLIEKLGEGTFAKVYKAVDQSGQYVAFKMYRIQDDENLCYFFRELSTVSTLGFHPHIVSVDRIIFKSKKHALTMELMDGTVYQLFKKCSNDRKELYIRDIAFQILQALLFMEQHQFAHRDVKGDNILFKQMDDEIIFKLADFNLTRSTRGEFFSGQISCLIHRPPETWSIKTFGKYDANKVDIWGLGSTLYLLLVGEHGVSQTFQSQGFFNYWSSILDMSSYTGISSNIVGIEKYMRPNTNPLLIDFLKCLLKPNPSERISAQDALQHPFLKSCVYTEHYVPKPEYLTTERFDWTIRHPDLVPHHRTILIDWLYDVSKEYQLGLETFHVGVQFLDVYMQKCIDRISRKMFQLVGCAAFSLTTYLLEFKPISVNEWEYLTESAYQRQQILDFIIHMFQTLECKLPRPQELVDVYEKCLVFPNVNSIFIKLLNNVL